MSRHLRAFGTLSTLDRAKRRVLVQELADYATPAERDELEVLIEASGARDDEAASILHGQAHAQLFRVG
jgi:hypothetical protein